MKFIFLKIFLCLFLLASFTSVTMAEIVVEGIDDTTSPGSISGRNLEKPEPLPDIAPRIVYEYAGSNTDGILEKPADIVIPPRIVVEYAESISEATLIAPNIRIPAGGIFVSETDITVSEATTSDIHSVSFTVSLATPPADTVTVEFSLTNNEIIISPERIFFTNEDWTQKTVTVTANDDDDIDGTRYSRILLSAHSNDTAYNISSLPSVTVEVKDNEKGIIVDSVSPSFISKEDSQTVLVLGTGLKDNLKKVTMVLEDENGNPAGSEIPVDTYNVFDDSRMNLTIPSDIASGSYRLRFYYGDILYYELGNAITYSEIPQVFKAIIVVGKSDDEPLWEASKDNAHYAWQVLLDRGYKKENIAYLSSELTVDIDGDGANDCDGDATLSVLNTFINQYATGKTMDQFVMYLVGHGGDKTFRISPSETLPAGTLSGYLDKIQNNLNEELGELIFVYDACSSGTFLEPLKRMGNRTVITSAGNHPAYMFDKVNLSFSWIFWSGIYSGSSVGESFYNAREMMKTWQLAQLDANGNGLSEEDEYESVNELYIGRLGIRQSDTPKIAEVKASDTVIKTEGAEIYFTAGPVTDADGIDTVWMIVTPLNTDGSSQNPSDEIILTPLKDDGYYGIPYSEFLTNGKYKVTFSATDKSRFHYVSEPVHITITRNCRKPGDFDLNDELTLADAIIVLKILAGISTPALFPSPYAEMNIDVNEDDKAGMEEVIYILQHTAGLR